MLAVPANGLLQATLDGVRFFGRLRGVMVSLNYAFFPVIVAIFIAAVIILLALKKLSLKSFSLICIGAFAIYLGGAGIYELAASTLCAPYINRSENDIICIRTAELLVIDLRRLKKDIQIDGLCEYFTAAI